MISNNIPVVNWNVFCPVQIRRRTAITLVLLVFLVGSVAGPAAASDHAPEPVDSCENAPTLEPGTYNSTITPDGLDVFTVDGMSQGDYITFNVEFDQSDMSSLNIYGAQDGGRYDYDRHLNGYNDEIYAGYDDTSIRSDDWDTAQPLYAEPEGTGELWLEAEETPCITIYSQDDGAGTYTLSFSVNDPEPPEIPDPSRVDELESQLQEREQQIEAQQDRISTLESELEQKNQTIEQLRTQLDTQESDTGEEPVTITVDVSPGGEKQNFISGGTADVELQSDNADLSNTRIEYKDATYDVGQGGQVDVALAGSGTQQLSIVYEDTRESVSLSVQQSASETDESTATQQDTEDGETASENGPGFGVGAVVVAIVVVALSALRRR